MTIKEERLHDPQSVDYENQLAQNLDATSTTVTTPSSNDIHTDHLPHATISNNCNATAISTTPTSTISATTASNVNSKRWFLLEPAVFLVFLGMYLSATVYQNQLLYQSCMYVFNHTESECEPLLGVERESPEVQNMEAKIQPYVAKILMARSLLESIIPAIVSLFIGPWSDKFGRRPIILTTFTGYLIGSIIITILIYISAKTVISPWLFLLGSVPSVLSGGTCALITGIYCYISDVANTKARAWRMVFNEASLSAGMMFGNVLSGYLYAATNTLIVFTISTALMLLALLYVCIFVTESLNIQQVQTKYAKLKAFFRFDLVKDLVLTCIKRRPNFDRAIIWLTMTALTLSLFAMEGDSNVTYLFVRRQFEWTLKDYTLFNAIRIVAQILGSLIAMYILKKLWKISIIGMDMIAMGSCVLESSVRATAIYWWELYIGLSLGFMRGILGPMSRAILSHVAPPNEVGKIYALTTSMESLSPIIAAPLYTIVYNATLTYNPGLFNFISAGIFLLCYTLIAAIYGIQKYMTTSSTYQPIGD